MFEFIFQDSTGNVIPEQRGEMQINLKEMNLFTVTGYKGQPQYNYICMQANHVALHHCGKLLISYKTFSDIPPMSQKD